MAAVIRVDKLTRRFGALCAVDNLSFEVVPGEVFGFLGHNGAGKTTTVRLLNGVMEPNQGQIRVLGLDPIADGPALRARTGVLTESAALDGRLTARENLTIFADLFSVPREQVSKQVAELFEFFGLAEHAEQKVATYSTGMRQRLALARTLLHEPEVLFLDEPTAGLDPLAAHQVNELIAHLAADQGRTVFLCTHNLVEAQKLCDRVAVLEHGRLMALGTPAELTRQYVQRLVVEVETAPQQVLAAREILAQTNPAAVLLPKNGNGHGLFVEVAGQEAIPEMLAQLVQHGIRVYRLAAQEPSLEDVYFALHGEGKKEN